MITNTSTGIDLESYFNKSINSLSSDGRDLQTRMDNISQNSNVNEGDLLQMQYLMSRYSTKITVLSEVQKAVTDLVKSLAAKAGG